MLLMLITFFSLYNDIKINKQHAKPLVAVAEDKLVIYCSHMEFLALWDFLLTFPYRYRTLPWFTRKLDSENKSTQAEAGAKFDSEHQQPGLLEWKEDGTHPREPRSGVRPKGRMRKEGERREGSKIGNQLRPKKHWTAATSSPPMGTRQAQLAPYKAHVHTYTHVQGHARRGENRTATGGIVFWKEKARQKHWAGKESGKHDKTRVDFRLKENGYYIQGWWRKGVAPRILITA